ncbi:MAG: membrane protein insertion efficiency factor YidD [Saccharofermentans sp.]|nr:membrane protein insertion efficiency factor YidD [Saccharofermentans sp.]
MTLKKVLIKLVKVYQKYISPAIGPHCKYRPTCSEYMIECLETYGVIKGLPRGIWRILRCNPFSKGGYDPVRPRS